MKAKALAPLILACGMSTGCLADNTGAYSAIRIAKLDLSESLEQLAQQEERCDESAVVLEPAPLLNAGLSKEELRTALAYFYLKASIQCSFKEASAVVTQLNALTLLQPEGSKDASEAAQLFTRDLVRLWEVEEKYMAIEESKRQRLEQAVDLSKPVKMIETAKRLGL